MPTRSHAIPILLYHSVPARADGDPLSVTRERFVAHVEAIASSGCTPLGIGELGAGMRGELALPERPVAITFDDAYANTPEAIGLLGDRGLRASVYVTTGQVGTDGMIAIDQLEALADRDETVELGAHSVSHPHLDELGPTDLELEIAGSKRWLEERVGRPIETFAYPYGSYEARARAATMAAGFRSAVAVKNAISHREDDPWAMARWTVRAGTGAERIGEILEGRGAPLAWRQERLRTRGYRAVRRGRRKLVAKLERGR